MKIALKLSAFTLIVALAATASASLAKTEFNHHEATAAVADPDPADCPFCGGNPAVHVRRLQDLERTTMALHANLLR